jgi:hypothetical protein
MRFGLLADIHEEVENLRAAITTLRDAGATEFVMLGDVYETGERLEETVAVLAPFEHVGVWGNHDFGLCDEPVEFARERFSAEVLAYFARLRPSAEVGGAFFQHIEPYLDSTSLEDLWSYGSMGRLDLARSFAAVPHRRIFIGHLHRWSINTPEGRVEWDGSTRVRLDRDRRYLIVIHAVMQGFCAIFDTDRDELVPLSVL